MTRALEVRKILSCKVNEANLHSYFIDFDIDENGDLTQMINKFVHLLTEEIPSFALGYHQGKMVAQEDIFRILTEAANSIYKIDAYEKVAQTYLNGGFLKDDVADKYLRRGEFGELILHFILKYFFNTLPLVAKIYFKDSFGHAVHGFDSVHINTQTNTLWLGESKLYRDGAKGIDALIEDLFEHFNSNYFESEFTIISKRIKDTKANLEESGTNPEYWIDLLNTYTKLSKKLDRIIIPMFCAYETNVFSKYNTSDFEKEYIEEIKKLNDRFIQKKSKHPWHQHLNIIVILVPMESKKKLISALHSKLKMLQMLGGSDF
ncbi:HamA C-terminal domain-containing protein [Lysinibacillus telephonicus]|uniref:HamA C-terminal domain-containing protein n=1 Tax=Lysinibacillus telephonicus TaxID=1714840 RepID=UPI003BA399ED